jgi:hypothetical protein
VPFFLTHPHQKIFTDFSPPTFSLMKKLAKDQADGWGERDGAVALTVGIALARSIRASF